MKKYLLYNKKADFAKIGVKFGVDPVIAKIMRNRDLIEESQIESFLYGKEKNLHSPWNFKAMEAMTDCLTEKIKGEKKNTNHRRLRYRRSTVHLYSFSGLKGTGREGGLCDTPQDERRIWHK